MQARPLRVRNGENRRAAGAGKRRGGSSPRRSAAALKAVGCCRPSGETPRYLGRLRRGTFGSFMHSLGYPTRLCSEPGQGRAVWRAEGVPLKLFVEKVATAQRAAQVSAQESGPTLQDARR